MSQNAKLLSYLQTHSSITTLEAMTHLGVCRLSERVRELEALGWVLRHERVSVPTRDGKRASVVAYSILSEPNCDNNPIKDDYLRDIRKKEDLIGRACQLEPR